MTTSYRKRQGKKYRGNRNSGYGKTGAHRKKGSQGGCGVSTGICKHFWQYYLRHRNLGDLPEGWNRGKNGFCRPTDQQRIYKVNAVNVCNLDANIDLWVSEGKAQKKGDTFVCNLADLNIQKLIGTGKITKKLEITVNTASEKAVAKFKEAKCKLTVQNPVQEKKEAAPKAEAAPTKGKKEK